MFLILKHIYKENSEYPANANYPDLTKQIKIYQHNRGTIIIHRINNLGLVEECNLGHVLKIFFKHRKISFTNCSIQIFTKKNSILVT